MNKELISQLRVRTNAPMKECIIALKEANDDLERAIDIVKTKGLNIVSGREGKVAAEGLLAVSNNNPAKLICLVEVNSNTDFVSNSPDFRKFVEDTVDTIHSKAELNQPFSVDDVEPARKVLAASTKENIVVRR